MVNEIKSALKGWYKPAVVLVVLVFGVGIGLTNAAPATVTVQAPVASFYDRPTRKISGWDAAAALNEVTLQSINQPANPPGGNQIVPRFSGLNVQGPIVNEGVGPIMIFDDAMWYGLTDVRNGLVNSSAPGGVATPLTIYDNLKVAAVNPTEPGDIIVDGSVKNSTATPLVLDSDGIYTNGDSIFGGNLSVSGAIRNLVNGAPFLIDDNASVSGDLTVSGIKLIGDSGIKNDDEAIPVKIKDALEVSGLITSSGTFVSIKDDLRLYSDTDVNGQDGAFVIRSFDSNVNRLQIDTDEIATFGNDLYLNKDTMNDVQIGDADSNSSLRVYGPLTVTGAETIGQNLTVTGNTNLLGTTSAATLTVASGATITGTTNIVSDTDVKPDGRASLKIGPAGSASWIGIDKNEIAAYGDNLYLNWDSGTEVKAGGAFTAASVGQYYKVDKTGTIAANTSGNVATKCSSGDTLIGCTGSIPANPQPAGSSFYGATIYYSAPTIECRTYAKAAGAQVSLISEAMCFNPDASAPVQAAGTTLTVLPVTP